MQMDSMSVLSNDLTGADGRALQPLRSPDGSAFERLPALQDDRWIYRMVVALLGLVMMAGLIGTLILVLYGKDQVPDIFLALGSGAVGALAGLLAPSPDKK